MSKYLNRLRKLSNNKRNVQSNASFIKAMDYIELLESKLELNTHDLKKYTGSITHEIGYKFYDVDHKEWEVVSLAESFLIASRTDIETEHLRPCDIMKIPIINEEA